MKYSPDIILKLISIKNINQTLSNFRIRIKKNNKIPNYLVNGTYYCMSGRKYCISGHKELSLRREACCRSAAKQSRDLGKT